MKLKKLNFTDNEIDKLKQELELNKRINEVELNTNKEIKNINEEELLNLNMKTVILNRWKSKLSYPFNLKDLEELENIIDYYEGENQKYKEVIDKIRKEINEEYSIMGVEVVENWVLKDILKEVE